MAGNKYGTIDAFDLNGKDNISEYIERVDEYFIANDIDADRKKVAIFLTVIGPATYKLLKNLLPPAKPNTKDYKTLSETFIGAFATETDMHCRAIQILYEETGRWRVHL